MDWATRQRVMILTIVGLVVAAFFAVILISAFNKTPSCFDGIQNEDEAGIDCGGPCQYLCTAQEQPPTVLFTQAINNGEGRIDVIASIENKNPTAAAKAVPYDVKMYGTGSTQLAETKGTVDLPPGASVPLFIPGVYFGSEKVVNAFLEIDPAAPKWYTLTTDPRIIPAVVNSQLAGTLAAPRVQAVLGNPSVTPLSNVPVIVMVRDVQGNVLAASSSIVPSIPGQSTANVIFTWNAPFAGTPTQIEVDPIIALP